MKLPGQAHEEEAEDEAPKEVSEEVQLLTEIRDLAQGTSPRH